MLTLIPAYGRDYKTAAAVKADWHDDRDFEIANHFHPYDGKPTNKEQTEEDVMIRFDQLRKTTVIRY